MGDRQVILCAGNPGSGRDEYIQKMLALFNSDGRIKYYHFYDYLLQTLRSDGYNLNKETILDFVANNQRETERIRAATIDEICEEMGDSGIHVVSTPYSFEWNGELIYGLTANDARKLNPDKFIVLLDDIVRIKERLRQDPQWSDKEFTLVELTKWRRTEVDGIEALAHQFDPPKEFYILPVEHNPKVLFELVTNARKKKIYLSYPITSTTEEERARTAEFARQIEDLYIIFDPITIKEWSLVEQWNEERDKAKGKKGRMPESIKCSISYELGDKTYECDSEEIRHAIRDIRHQIVERDYMLINASDYVVAYHQRRQISAGVICELVHGKTNGKFVYVMYPYEPSPFLEYYSHRLFTSTEQLLEFLKKAAE